MKAKYLSAVFLLAISQVATAYDGWSTGIIDSVRLHKSQTSIVQIGAKNPNECSEPKYLVLPDDGEGDDFTKRANATLLAAQVAGKVVHLALTGCSRGDKVGSPVITEVWITNKLPTE